MSIPCLSCVRSMKFVEMYMSPEIVLLTGDVLSILLSLHIFSPIRKYSTSGPQMTRLTLSVNSGAVSLTKALAVYSSLGPYVLFMKLSA